MAEQAKATLPPKAKKKKGPIRFEAIVPLGVLTALIVLYITLFFDGHLRRAIEWGGSRANGAEVNVAALKSSFLGGWMRLDGIEVTKLDEPAKNRLEIGEVKFQYSWEALLRGKLVIDEAGVRDIQANSPRKQPGFVLPVEETAAGSKLYKLAKEQVMSSALGDFAKLLDGFDPTKELRDVGANLKSAARIQELKAQLGTKEKEWASTLAALPGEKEVAALQQKITSIQVGGSPAEIPGKVKLVQSVIQETQEKVTSVQQKGEALKNDVGSFETSLKQVDDLAKQDREGLEAKLHLPSLDTKDLAKQLFGGMVLGQLGAAERYVKLARQYMPAKKNGKAEPVEVKHVRGVGRSYEFGQPNSYPRFWLRKADISSKGEHTAFGGDITGEILDVTTNPAQIGRPAILRARGDFPKSGILKTELLITVDHTTDSPRESLKAKVGVFPVVGRLLSDSPNLKFAFGKAVGGASFELGVRGDQLKVGIESSFKDIDYQISSSSKILEQTFQGVVKDIPVVHVSASAVGPWDGLDLSISSNLASGIAAGLQKQLQARIAEARAKIQGMINEKIDGARAQLTSQVTAMKSKLTAQIDEKRKKVDAVKSQAESKLNAVKAQASSGALDKAKDLFKKKNPFGR